MLHSAHSTSCRYAETMCGNAHLLPDENGTPPWRRPGVRPYVLFLAAFAAFDALLIALTVVNWN